MTKRVVVDLDVMRRNPDEEFRCVYLYHPLNKGVATLRELAAFEMFCRKCELACCIESCPKGALEKDESGVVRRRLFQCIGCWSHTSPARHITLYTPCPATFTCSRTHT